MGVKSEEEFARYCRQIVGEHWSYVFHEAVENQYNIRYSIHDHL